jgi:hypothetical protein
MREQQRIADGVPAADARFETRRRFGNPALLKETCRDLWTFTSIESLWRDVRYGTRSLLRSPGLTLAAVVSPALAIGANTAIFSIVDSVLLRSIPVREPGRLVQFEHFWSGSRGSFSYPLADGEESNPRRAATASHPYNHRRRRLRLSSRRILFAHARIRAADPTAAAAAADGPIRYR